MPSLKDNVNIVLFNIQRNLIDDPEDENIYLSHFKMFLKDFGVHDDFENLENTIEYIKKDMNEHEISVIAYASYLDNMLDDLLGEDFFGTEGQLDPRGDGRDGEWEIIQANGEVGKIQNK